ncbi:MAG: DUF1501 domain-containing protein, partial [Pirellulaceae bacterium]
FDWKPGLAARRGEELPESVRRGQRLTTMTADHPTKPIAPSPFRFARHGACGAAVSELLPFTAGVVDELCIVRSLFTEAINHDPAMTMLQTGVMRSGHPSIGAWVGHGLGTETEDLPRYVVMFSGGEPGDQPLSARLWGSAFLPSQNQGVRFSSGPEPVLYLANPPGLDASARRQWLDAVQRLNRRQLARQGDPEIAARMAQFELAYQMQTAVPSLADIRDEPERTFARYGDEARQPGTYAANCLLARRLVERGVRFVQLFHRGWDHHDRIESRLRKKCLQTDRPSAALVSDLRERGLLEDTLVVWAGEFGRTVYSQGVLEADTYGRDHHPRCFTVWLAGGGTQRGRTYGETDDFSYQVVRDGVHVHDLHATILHLLGVDHERLTARFQGRDQRLTDIGGTVVPSLLR